MTSHIAPPSALARLPAPKDAHLFQEKYRCLQMLLYQFMLPLRIETQQFASENVLSSNWIQQVRNKFKIIKIKNKNIKEPLSPAYKASEPTREK